jgi:hypothetical protein
MPAFTYIGNEGQYYPTLGLTPVPGRSYPFHDEAPDDGRWVAKKPAKSPPSAEEK